jgi:hypothetical protein
LLVFPLPPSTTLSKGADIVSAYTQYAKKDENSKSVTTKSERKERRKGIFYFSYLFLLVIQQPLKLVR